MMGQKLNVKTPSEYLAALEGDRKKDITALHKLIRKAAPKLKPFIHSGMLAYGPFHYRYESGREGDWFKIGVSNNKQYISLYACAIDEKKKYVAEGFKKALPKASIGKSCVRFKKLSDLDLDALAALIQKTEQGSFGL